MNPHSHLSYSSFVVPVLAATSIPFIAQYDAVPPESLTTDFSKLFTIFAESSESNFSVFWFGYNTTFPSESSTLV